VVKNVTGYDLSKLMAGSWGTLGIMTDVTIKVLPRAEAELTVLVLALDAERAVKAMAVAMGSANEVSGAAHVPAESTPALPGMIEELRAVTALRLEGVPPSVAHRREQLLALMKPFGDVAVLEGAASQALWASIRDVMPFALQNGPKERPLWRISSAPMSGPEIVKHISAQVSADVIYDWAGGLIWMQLASHHDPHADLVHRAVAAQGGHATLIRASAGIRAAVDVFEPQPAPLAALTRRVKDSFDPKRVLAPGRMYAGV
ncbi:MAG TPA: 2-hydroxy-acid oxidase, partial [Xanthobacteraceae bacterium]|nr:2-hydroxy-acid oxidase [Xanthobacteraceae bacterium]